MKRTYRLIIGIAFVQILLTAANSRAQSTIVYGFAARQTTLNGYDLFTDSYNSGDTNRSSAGLYDPAKAGDLGNVWSEGGILNSIGVGNVSIWGKLTTGSSYSLQMGPDSSIGSMAWHQSGQLGIQPGYLQTGFMWQFPDVLLPFTTWMEPAGGTYDGESYNYLLNTGDYRLSSLNLSGNEKMVVAGSARLYVPDELSLKGNATLRILPGAQLILFVGAETANISGTGIVNEGVARQFIYFGLPGNHTLNLRFTTPLIGLIYAPQAICYVTAKGNAAAEMEGVVIVQEVELGAALRFHYDEAVNGGTPR